MSKKKVMDYDPKTGFGNFAEIMNKNNALDMARNGVNMPANNMAGAPLEIGTLGGTQAQSGMLKVDTATPSLAEAAGVTEDTVATDTETGTVTGTDASTGANTGAVSGVTSNLTGLTAQPILSVPGYKSDMGTEDEWMAKNGYDPDRDYDEKKAALEYDYETSMATYGRRAEELAQMGLSNSGLSDIYQLGAFNSYLQQQNQIANERIAAKKKYKQEYNTLYQQNQDALKLDNANAYNLGLSLYDGKNIDFVRQQLTQQGYDAGVVEQAVQSLAALDVNTLPVVQKQNAARNEKIKNAVEYWLQNGYDSNEADSVRSLYATQEDWDQADIDKLISQLNAYSDTTDNALVEEGLAAFYAANPNFVYDGSEAAKERVRQMLAGTEFAGKEDAIIKKFDADMKASLEAPGKDILAGDHKAGSTLITDDTLNAWQAMIDNAPEEEKEAKRNEIQAAIGKEIDNVLNSDTKMKDLYNFAGYSKAEWDELDLETQSDEITQAVLKYRQEGFVSNEKFKEYYNNIIDATFDAAHRQNHADTEDNNNRYSLGFMKDVANMSEVFVDLHQDGKISDDDYYEILDTMYQKLDVDEQKGLFRNMFVDTNNDANWWGQAIQDYTGAIGDVVTNIGSITIAGSIPQLLRSGAGHLMGEVTEDSFGDQIGGMEDPQRRALAEIYYAAYKTARDKDTENEFGEGYLQQGTRRIENLFGWKNNAVTNLMEERYALENPKK